MSPAPSASPLESTDPEAPQESRPLRNLLLAGCLAAVVNWLLESVRGELTWWDAIAYPALGLLFAGGAAVLHRWPERSRWVRVSTVGALNLYLVSSLYLVLFESGRAPDAYSLITTLFWLPLGYGAAFVFLSRRDAMGLSVAMYGAIFGPVMWHLARGTLPEGSIRLLPIMTNLAIAQVVYIVLLQAISKLRVDMQRSRERADLMLRIATTDALTGLANRRAMGEWLAGGMSLVQRGAQALSVLLIDVDRFKHVNDTRGHAAGDAVLSRLGELLPAQLRASDLIGRWGGEEFLVLAPATGLEPAGELAERMRAAVERHDFGDGLALTISIGVAQGRLGETPEQLLKRADQALYDAKNRGRNRVCAEAPPAEVRRLAA